MSKNSPQPDPGACASCAPAALFSESPVWNFALGFVELLIGIFAITWPFPASIGVDLGIGVLLAVAAIFQLIAAFRSRGRAIIWHIVSFLVYAVIAFIFYQFGIFTLQIITLVIGLTLIFLGISRTSLAITLRETKAWGWALFNGLVTIALGCLITFNWPDSSIWTLGILIGVNLLFDGFALISLSLAQFKSRKQQTPPAP